MTKEENSAAFRRFAVWLRLMPGYDIIFRKERGGKMADETFELLTKMYADFTSQFKEVRADISELKGDVSELKGDVSELKGNVSTLNGDVSSLKDDMKSVKSQISRLELKLENDISRKVDLLLETRVEVNKRLDVIENKIDILSSKVDKHDIEIKVIKAAK